MTVKAKVARVLSDYEVAFNVGANAGLSVGDVATVYGYVDVNDPDTKEELGRVRRPRVKLRVIEVEPGFSVGQTTEWASSSGGDQSTVFHLALGLDRVRQKVTGNPSEQNRVTVYLRAGDEVEIEPGPKALE